MIEYITYLNNIWDLQQLKAYKTAKNRQGFGCKSSSKVTHTIMKNMRLYLQISGYDVVTLWVWCRPVRVSFVHCLIVMALPYRCKATSMPLTLSRQTVSTNWAIRIRWPRYKCWSHVRNCRFSSFFIQSCLKLVFFSAFALPST